MGGLSLPVRHVGRGRSVMVLTNPGRGSRYYLAGIINALGRLGLRHIVVDLAEIWALGKSDPAELVRRISRVVVEHKVSAVIGYGHNGMVDMPVDPGPLQTLRSFFEIRGIVHLMVWLDHPQWHTERIALTPRLQPLFRSGGVFHFMKSAAHAAECQQLMGWPQCYELPAAVDGGQMGAYPPVGEAAPEFDIVAICSENGAMAAWLMELTRRDDPDPGEIRKVIAGEVRERMTALWRAEAPDNLRAELQVLGEEWIRLKTADASVAAVRHIPALIERFPGPMWWLHLNYPVYFKAATLLWRLREWERRFYVAYLAKYFKIGMWGGDWSMHGLGPGGWVDFPELGRTYRRGKLALNIVDGHDEEGVTIKPFEIAASGVAMVHYRQQGLESLFENGKEVAVFERPAQAREIIAGLLADEPRRQAMGAAARDRLLRDHTWERRIIAMLETAGLERGAFLPG